VTRAGVPGIAAVALLAILTVLPIGAQYRGGVEVDAVVVPVTVRTRHGRVVKEVSARRFHLRVDGMPIPIQDLAPEEGMKLSLAFIVDTSGSMAGHRIEACRDLINAFLAQRKPGDEYALWTFGNERVLERFPFGMSWYLLPRILETLKPWATTALYDMIQRVPEVAAGASHPRRAVILLTDGVDNASKLSADEATTIAQRVKTPIYIIGVEPPPRQAVAGGATYEEILELIAELSGGRYERVPSTDQMPATVAALLEELSSRFILSFNTSGIGQKKWRRIEVTVDGYEASARKGYFGTLP